MGRSGKGAIAILVVLAIAVLVFGNIFYAYGTVQKKDIVVKKTWIKSPPGEDKAQIYMVADNKGNTYKIQDTYLHWRFNSSDLWAELDAGKKYHIKCFGWRVGFLTWYPNIFSVEKSK